VTGRLEALGRLVRSSLARERLPDPPPPVDIARPPSRLRWLLAPEPLPEAPSAAPRAGRSLLAILFSREALSLEPERVRKHRNWLSFLFSPERLDPPAGPGPEVH